MPTGYTAALYEGKPQTFEAFVWDCARAFGALVMMRDDSRDAPIPERFEPTDYHVKALAKAKAERERIVAMLNTEADEAAAAEFEEARRSHQERVQKMRDRKTRYLAMRAKVEAWAPPSKDHEGLRAFMLEQIGNSIDFDCDEEYMAKPTLQTGSAWRAAKIAALDHDLQYHHDEHAKEVARTEQRNAWLVALRASVPYPCHPKGDV